MSTPRRPGVGRPAAGRPSAGRRPARAGTRSAAARPSTPRPAGASPAAQTPRSQPRRSGSSTARALVLALVAGVLVLSAALPLREFLTQRGQIADLEQSQAQAQARVAELEAERTRLADPAYVAAEARRHLHFVYPQETSYVLLEPSPAPDAAGANSKRPGGAVGPEAPWYSQVWGSVQAADRPAPAPTP